MSNLIRNGPALRPIPPQSSSVGAKSRSCRIPVDELLTAQFLSRHTKFENFAALLDASGLNAEGFSNLEGRADNGWDEFMGRVSRYSDWSEMLMDARGEWMMRRLGIVVDA